jgi:hypothetical protein
MMFVDTTLKFRKLNHPNIAKLIGGWIARPYVCIVTGIRVFVKREVTKQLSKTISQTQSSRKL